MKAFTTKPLRQKVKLDYHNFIFSKKKKKKNQKSWFRGLIPFVRKGQECKFYASFEPQNLFIGFSRKLSTI